MKLFKITQIIPAFFLILTRYPSETSQGGPPIPYALSPVYLQYLENVENQIYQQLKSRTEEVDPQIQRDVVQRFVSEYESYVTPSRRKNGSHEITGSIPQYVVSSNPILSLQMINRFVKYFKGDGVSSFAKGIMDPNALPSETEVTDAMEALLRVQYIYDLDANEIANGYLDGIKTSAYLSTRECFELGKFAQESAYFTLALQWYDVTLNRLRNDKSGEATSYGLKESMVLKAIQETIDEHNEDFEENIEEGDMYSFQRPIFAINYSQIAHLSLRKTLAQELTGSFLEEKDPKFYQAMEANMMALCHGQDLQSPQVKKKLTCWLDTKRHPYFRINPLKIELLHENPPVIQIYEIFNDKWNAYLKNLSYGELERAPQPPEATPRTAAYAWFEDTEIPKAPISKTVEYITGLNVRGTAAAESLQVAAYAFGGHVEPHFDSRGPDDPEFGGKGDRVTTFLVYLNEVEKGGYTAFPLLGVHIKPVKNSAVLWYTNLKNGEIDENMLHAACPVITGHKWIATKWTHINENILKRPCGLRPDE